jgi:O-antigen ligase
MLTWSRSGDGMARLWPAWVCATTLAVILGAVAAALPALVGRTVLGACVAAAFVRFPYVLVLTWGVSAMFGDNRLDVLGGQSIFGALTYLSLPCFAIVAAPRIPRLVRRQPWLGIWIVFVLLVLINLPRSPLGLAEAVRQFIGFPATIGIVALTATELTSARRAAGLTWSVLIPAVGVAAFGCYQYFAGVGGVDSQGVYRVFSIFDWTNTLAFFLIVPLGWAALELREARTLRGRLPPLAAMLVMGACEFFTFGRGGWLGAALALGGPLLIVGPPARISLSRPLVLGSALAAVAIAITFLPGLDLSTRVEDVANIQGRAMIWDYVFGRAMDDPIIGQGFWASAELTAQAVDDLVSQGVHNSYLMIFFDYGLVGLTVFCAVWVALLIQLALLVRASERAAMRLLLAVAFTTLGVLLYSGTGLELVDFAPSMYLWLMLGWATRSLMQTAPSGARPFELSSNGQAADVHAEKDATQDKQLKPLRPAHYQP